MLNKIDKEGVHKKDKNYAILNAIRRVNVSQIKDFLSLFTYYSKFVMNLSTFANPLNQLLRNIVRCMWTSILKHKKEITSERGLTHFNLNLLLATDTSPYNSSFFLLHVLPDNTKNPLEKKCIAYAVKVYDHALTQEI